ncbi:MAG: hypothetical protein V4671_16160 [Armatimonadota bacterium]
MPRHRDSQPSVRSTTHLRAGCFFSPASSLVSRLLTDATDVRHIPVFRNKCGRCLVAFVQTQVQRLVCHLLGTLDNDGI